MKVSDIVIQFLQEKGIDTTFTISGGGCIHLIDSLRKSNMNVVCPHHEQAALISAEGYTRMNGKVCASVVTTVDKSETKSLIL
jgi:acetolactate synthase-1/2/3 large subunit